MSFAVFGVSIETATKQARMQLNRIRKQDIKKTERQREKLRKDGETHCAFYRYLNELIGLKPTQETFDETVQELIPQLMKKLTPKQLSPLYSMPSICEEFKTIAKKHGAVKLITKQQVAEPDKKIHGKFKRVWKEPKPTFC
ncbi:hypothetical protein TW85_21760 [Marinomonas sp. S3726]|uniref:hypothetical protein n=1 Tax=Marinomonas sp. S3726 TaxID=579484 RepID=UPI0005FA7FF4|nr:hypothetical protein [Marinomonas sp. S3726]KJZ09572.1 hypothetical protein TW85_21760 [Marinomonas sp. S3726]